MGMVRTEKFSKTFIFECFLETFFFVISSCLEKNPPKNLHVVWNFTVVCIGKKICKMNRRLNLMDICLYKLNLISAILITKR